MAEYQYVLQEMDDGAIIGAAATSKLAFYGGTPIVQRSGAAQAAIATTLAVTTTTALWGFSTSTQANDIVTLCNELRALVVALNLAKGSA